MKGGGGGEGNLAHLSDLCLTHRKSDISLSKWWVFIGCPWWTFYCWFSLRLCVTSCKWDNFAWWQPSLTVTLLTTLGDLKLISRFTSAEQVKLLGFLDGWWILLQSANSHLCHDYGDIIRRQNVFYVLHTYFREMVGILHDNNTTIELYIFIWPLSNCMLEA